MTSISINRQDGLSSATSWKGPVRVATTTNIQLSDLQVIDGVMLAAGDRVLVKDQTDARYNGIWVVDTGLWRRARDFASNRDVREGTQVFVVEGATYNRSGWYVSSNDPIQIGTTDIQFTQNMLINTEQLEQLVQQAEAARDAAQAAEDAANSVLDSMLERSVGSFASDTLADQFLVDNGLSKFPGTIYFNTTGSVWKYWDGSAWLSFPYATIADGSVTDAKLPDYDASTSPSASKLRYQASTSSGAIAGSQQRPVQLKLSDILHAYDFGVKADGVTNDTAAMVAAFSAMEQTGRPLFLPSGVIMVNPDALYIGNGSDTNGSTYNGQKIIGAGASIANAAGTILRARQAGNVLFEVRGIIGGVQLSGVHFDCANLANTGVTTHSMSESVWSNFHISNFKFYGFRQLCRVGPASSAGWSAGCSFNQFLIASQFVGAYGAGIDIDGKPLNNYDPHRNTWSTGTVSINRYNGVGPTSGIILGFADSNTFLEVDFTVSGVGQGYGVTYNALSRTAFPQNNFMYGCSVTSFNVIEDGSHVSGTNLLVNHTTQDGETLPTHSKIIGFTDVGQWISNLQINKDFGDLVWRNRAGTVWWRIRNNAGTAGDNFLNIERSTNGTSWTLCMRFDPADGVPWFNIPSVGLKKMEVGAVDSGGTGFRRLVVSN